MTDAASPLKARIVEDMKSAMRAKEKERLSVIRMLLSECKQIEVDKRITLSDTDVLAILDKMVKQRRDSVVQFREANREDLATQNQFEIDTLLAYLPTPLTEDEVTALIQAAIQETAAEGPRDMGKVMAHLKPQIQGRADMKLVSNQVKTQLG